jgi:outer membrane protein OmpA-like peptidoglycan-associated protein
METATVYDSQTVRPWLWKALVLSLLFHAALLLFFRSTKLERFSTSTTERLVPRAFNASRVEIDPKLLQNEDKVPDKKAATQLAKIQLPADPQPFDKIMDELRVTPTAPEPVKPIVNEKPKVEATDLQALAKQNASRAMDSELESLSSSVIHDKPNINRSLLNLAEHAKNSASAGATDDLEAGGSGPAGFSNLDNLLGQSGGLKNGVAPILMPTDLLFDYDRAELRVGAVNSLQKLGKLIQRNPQAVFTIEGHTDSIGSSEYNQTLSERRAESLKLWLVENMNIAPEKIRTRGYGSSRLIAPASGTVEQQQINRRAEIVIRTPH